MASAVLKPPNILIYSEENFFTNIAKKLLKCLHSDKYVIYPLKPHQVNTIPWKENVGLLVVFSEQLNQSISEEFLQYVMEGGKLLLVCSNFNVPGICTASVVNEDFSKIKYQNFEVTLHRGKYSYSISKGCILATDEENEPVITKIDTDSGILIASSVNLLLEPSMISSLSEEQLKNLSSFENNLSVLKDLLTEKFGFEAYSSDLPAPTCGYLIVESETRLKHLMENLTISEVSLVKSSKAPSEISQSPELKVPLLTSYDDLKVSLFDKDSYYSALESHYFGRSVVFFPVVTSTMYPAEQFSDYPGLVVIANRQLSGKGRSDNIWISPEGSAAFTLHFPLMLSSKLGQRLSILQHMASLAVVDGLRQKPGYGDIDFCLKWPNDIYYEKDKKIGGVLVNTTIQGDVVHVYIGIGVNVSNERPTVCVNSIIEQYNVASGKSLPHFKVEEVIAITLSKLEQLVKDFTHSGSVNFLDLYYKYWIHKDQFVTLSDSNVEASVISIDDYGFLIVETKDCKKLSLQPDGNRFDMMKNLIVTKEL